MYVKWKENSLLIKMEVFYNKEKSKEKMDSRNTPYCYSTIKHNKEGMAYRDNYCKNLVFDHYFDDVMIIPDAPGSTTTKEVPCRWPVYRCRYTEVTTLEDPCLYDDVKICGIGEPKDY